MVDFFYEQKKLKERDDIRSAKIMIIPTRCRHTITITHSNGDIECRCGMMWIKPEHRDLYPNRMEIEEKHE